MKKINKRTMLSKEVIRQYESALNCLLKKKEDAIKVIEQNPFLKRKWTFLDRILNMGHKMPPTPYEESLSRINEVVDREMKQLKLITEAQIGAIYKTL